MGKTAVEVSAFLKKKEIPDLGILQESLKQALSKCSIRLLD
jgi:hypothetical protein